MSKDIQAIPSYFVAELKAITVNRISVLKVFLGITAGFIVFYWGLVFTGAFPVNEMVPGYTNWFMSFPVADLYFAVTAVLSIMLMKKNQKLAGVLQ